MDREAWQPVVRGVSQRQTQLKRLSVHTLTRKEVILWLISL